MNRIRMSLLLLTVSILVGSVAEAEVRQELHFPAPEGLETLPCDFHMHTVFSDGQVWPPVRVDEAWRQGLDAIAITDHIEYRPHKADLLGGHNRPYELARGSAATHGLLFPRAAEITRDTPPGHFNALFLEDIDPLDTPEFLDAIKAANTQGAFLFWNHQGWQGEEKGKWLDVHTTMLEKGWLHGMEICNNESYYPNAHKWALEKGLTMVGNSDVHAPDRRDQNTSADHRTLTLVFVEARTPDGLKEALHQGRTVVWYKEQLLGKEEWLAALFANSVRVHPPNVRSGRNVWVEVSNLSSADVLLERAGLVGPTQLTLPAGTTTLVKIVVGESAGAIHLEYKATNFLIGPGKALPVVLKIPAPAS